MASLFGDFRFQQSSTRPVQLGFLRSIDLNVYRTGPPNLDEIKVLTSSLADCSFLSMAPTADLMQALSAMQLVVQFTLHSQRIMRDKLNLAQNQNSNDRASAGLIASFESRCRDLSAAVEGLQSEKRALLAKIHQMEYDDRTTQGKIAILERDLRHERHLRSLAAVDVKALTLASHDGTQHHAKSSRRRECCSHRSCCRRSSRRCSSRRHRRRDYSSSSSSSVSSSSSSSDSRRRGRSRKSRKSRYSDPTNIPVACVYPTAAEGRHELGQAPSRDQALLDAIRRLEADNGSLRQSLDLIRKEQEVCYRHVLKASENTAKSENVIPPQRSTSNVYVAPHQYPAESKPPIFAAEEAYFPPRSHQHVPQGHSGASSLLGAPAAVPYYESGPPISARAVASPGAMMIPSAVSHVGGGTDSRPIQQAGPIHVVPDAPVHVATADRPMTPMEEYLALKKKSQQERAALGSFPASFVGSGSIVGPAREAPVAAVKRYDSLVQSDGSRSDTEAEPPVVSANIASQRLPDSKPPTAAQSRRDSAFADTDSAAARFLSNLSRPKSAVLSRTGSSLPAVEAPRVVKPPTPEPSKSRSPSETSASSSASSPRKVPALVRRERTPSSSSSSSSHSSRQRSNDKKNESTLVSPVKMHSESLAKLNSFHHASEINSPVSKGNPFDLRRDASTLLDASATSSVAKRPTSRLLQETQSELQRLLEEEAEEEARKAANKSQLD